jgi:hypothetical protein
MNWKAHKSDCTKSIERLNLILSKHNIELFFIHNIRYHYTVDKFDLFGNMIGTLVTGNLQEINMYLGGMEYVLSLDRFN